LRTIESSGDHLLGLINDVLDISKIEAGREELHQASFDLEGFVEGISSMFELRCQQKGLAWHVDIDLPHPQVRGDENRLRQVLINLLGNAVKFTQEGRVELRVREEGGDQFRFAVEDTGPGIPAARQAAVFEPFQQEEAGIREGGTGLGLAIAHQHVALMGGALELRSVEEQGSTFSFALRLEPGDEAASTAPVEEPRRVVGLAEGSAVHALVVDDVAENRGVLGEMLSGIGVSVSLAAGGAEALEEVERERPDIIFMDIRMPGMDGPETRRRIVEAHADQTPRIVAVSASALAHEQERFLEEGFDAYIGKPFPRERIHAVLAELLAVELEYAERDEDRREEDVAEGVDLAGLSLPDDLSAELLAAVKMHSMTRVQQQIEKLEQMGEAERQLAAQLRSSCRQYDMNGIKSVVTRICGVPGELVKQPSGT